MVIIDDPPETFFCVADIAVADGIIDAVFFLLVPLYSSIGVLIDMTPLLEKRDVVVPSKKHHVVYLQDLRVDNSTESMGNTGDIMN